MCPAIFRKAPICSLQSEFQPVSFGNILIGGLIGLTVDATTGAMRKYPEEQYFVLIPGEFSSVDAAHDYFNELSDHVQRRQMFKEGILKPTCLNAGSQDPDCQIQNKEMSKTLRKKLELVEEKRSQALDRVTGRSGTAWKQPTVAPADKTASQQLPRQCSRQGIRILSTAPS